MPDQLVSLTVRSGVATVTLDSPANRNALSGPVRAQLAASLREVADDPAVRVLVLTHTGPAFCAGMDLVETAEQGGPERGLRELVEILLLLARSRQPVLARVSGAVRGGGIGLVAASDIVVASAASTFAFSEVRLGLVPAVISLPVLSRVPVAAARELMLTGAVFDATRAERIGLVNTIATDDADLAVTADRAAADLILGAPGAQTRIRSLLTGAPADLERRYADLLTESVRGFTSGEASEGIAARRGQRQPRWVPRSEPGGEIP